MIFLYLPSLVPQLLGLSCQLLSTLGLLSLLICLPYTHAIPCPLPVSAHLSSLYPMLFPVLSLSTAWLGPQIGYWATLDPSTFLLPNSPSHCSSLVSGATWLC